MKKVYEKPRIMFESFTLSTSIAGDCVVKTWLPSNTTCGMEMSGMIVFSTSVTGCEFKVSEGGIYNSICYHVPEGNNLFNS